MERREWERWLEQAQQGTRLESRGSFTLDLAAAARAFGQYALSDPIEIVARFVRVGVLCAESEPIEIEMMRDRVEVKIPGNASSTEAMKDVFSQVLSSDPAEREFAIAMSSLAARDYRELSVLRAQPSRVALLSSQGRGDFQMFEGVDLNQQRSFTVVSWREPWQRPLSDRLQWLKRAFRFCPQPLRINGQLLEEPFGRPRQTGMVRSLLGGRQVLYKAAWYRLETYIWADHHALEYRVFHPRRERNEVAAPWPGLASNHLYVGETGTNPTSCFMLFGMGCDPLRPSELSWVYRGQQVASEPAAFPLPGLQGVIACEGLSLDLTGARLVEGGAQRARRQFADDWLDVLSDYLGQLFPEPAATLLADRRPLSHRLLSDRRLRGAPQRLPHTQRVKELLARMRY